jgi:hypothetical protein
MDGAQETAAVDRLRRTVRRAADRQAEYARGFNDGQASVASPVIALVALYLIGFAIGGALGYLVGKW